MSSPPPTTPSFSNTMNMNGMSMNGPSSNVPPALQPVAAQYTKWMRQYRHLLDMSAPHVMHRWIGTSVVASLFMLRIVLAQGVSTFFLLAPVVALEDRILILLHLRACLASPAVSAHLVVHRYVPRLLQCQRLMTANGTFVYFPVFEQCAVSPIILTSTMTFILISSRFRRTWDIPTQPPSRISPT